MVTRNIDRHIIKFLSSLVYSAFVDNCTHVTTAANIASDASIINEVTTGPDLPSPQLQVRLYQNDLDHRPTRQQHTKINCQAEQINYTSKDILIRRNYYVIDKRYQDSLVDFVSVQNPNHQRRTLRRCFDRRSYPQGMA